MARSSAPSRSRQESWQGPRHSSEGTDTSFLTPLVGRQKRSRFCTFDLESKDGDSQRAGFTRIFLAGLYDGEEYQAFFDQSAGGDWKSRYFLPGGSVDRLLRTCLQDAYRGYTFYAHNAGNFDFLFLLPWLVRQKRERDLQIGLIPLGASGLLAIDVWKTEQKHSRWRFVDSVRLLPMSLEAAGKAFGVGQKRFITEEIRQLLEGGASVLRKLREGSLKPPGVSSSLVDASGRLLFDRDGQLLNRRDKPFTIEEPEDDPAWPLYNEQDCRLLYGVIEKVHDFIEVEFGGEVGLTAPSTSLKTFRRAHLKEMIPREVHTHEFVRRSYVGGRTEVIEEFISHGHYFDINSSYVHQMTLDLPAGPATVWDRGEPPRHLKETRVGFVECTVDVPDDLPLPPLPVKARSEFFPEGSGVEGKLVFPTGVLSGVWEWDELQNAVACGCRILDWKKSVWFEKKPLLREFVELLYRYRNKSKCFRCSGSLGAAFWCEKCQSAGYDAGLDALAKLLGNSHYGKYAQNPLRGKFYWVTDPEMPEGCVPLIEDDPDCQVWFKEETVDAPFILPQISARVTALGRVQLHRYAMEALRRIVRECLRCHSKVTFAPMNERPRSKVAAVALGQGTWVDMGGSGTYGDMSQPVRLTKDCASCPCGGALEARFGRVYYMDTDAVKTDVILPTGSELGELKDELPRYSGFLEGRFYGPKLYRLSVSPDYVDLPEELRFFMLKRDKGYFTSLEWDVLAEELRVAALSGKTIDKKTKDGETVRSIGKDWDQVKAKGMGKKNRTAENLETLYQGALLRLRWLADPTNRHPDGRPKKMPPEIAHAGTVYEDRLEKVGTLSRLIKRNEKGGRILKRNKKTGEVHRQSAAFERGPLMRTTPKRLHLEGAKRIHLGDGTTRPYHIDMRRKLGEAN